MADTYREITREEIESIAAKLEPAVSSLTDSEREIFALILKGVGDEDSEVSGSTSGGAAEQTDQAPTTWANPLAAQLAEAVVRVRKMPGKPKPGEIVL